ncbi:hypothetical protein RDI58_019472 [Solanum bulbocastanum]|uniref:F-box/LRR-repeat protein 15/At3g58940/PEG3-like LRR domain-containing protein n=1 Tax=Solanum bulbocastanum TaxID=147425 RepID=A0AAN8Y7L2_SOLBU
MFNCSTNMGTFMAFKSSYECVSHSMTCEWRFDENFTYRYSPMEEEWIALIETFITGDSEEYTFPQFAYKNTLLRNLVLGRCQLNPFGTVNWTNLISLSLEDVKLTHGSMKKILAGCPNLECLELKTFYGINCLEINNVKLREVTIKDYRDNKNGPWLEIFAPHIQKLQLLGYCGEIRIRQRNVASLVTIVIKAVFCLYIDHDDEEYNLRIFTMKNNRIWRRSVAI